MEANSTIEPKQLVDTDGNLRDLHLMSNELLREIIIAQQDLIRSKEDMYGAKSDLYLRMQLEYRNQVSKFNDLRPFLNKEGLVKLDKLLKYTPADSNNFNKKLEFEFNAVNHPVYRKLEKVAPMLSKNERLMCMYIHLNYAPKSVAFLTSKTVNAVNVAFNRIRVKMGLKNNDELARFLDQLA